MIVVAGKIPDASQLVKWLEGEIQEEIVYEPDLDKALSGLLPADIIIGPTSRRVTAKRISECKTLRWYHALSAGINDLPLEQFARQNILLTNSSGIHAIPMAEHIFGVMLMFSRNLREYVENQLEQEWSKNASKLGELYGKTLGIVGAGRIGQAVAERAKAFGMKVIGVKRNPAPLANFDWVTSPDKLNNLLTESDYVLLLTPLTQETSHFFGAQQFVRMKSSAVLLNFARGSVVDEEALLHALNHGTICAAGLDVTEREPLPVNHPLWRMKNVILTPHVAGISERYYERAMQLFAENYQAWTQGSSLPNKVDLSLGY